MSQNPKNVTRTTAHPTKGEERKLSWTKKVISKFPNRFVLTSFMDSLGVEEIDEVEFKVWLQDREPTWVKYVSGGPTDIVVDTDNAYRVVAGALLYNHVTQEIMRVDTDPVTGTGITVTRDFTGYLGAAGALAANTILRVIGYAHEESFTSGSAISSRPEYITNYMQNITEVVDLSDDLAMISLDWGKEKPRLVENAMFRFYTQLELAMLFGQASEDLTGVNGKPIRTMGGLNNFVSTHKFDFSAGSLTEALIDQYLEEQFRHIKGNELVGIAGGKFAMYFHRVCKASSHINVVPEDESYGFKGMKYITPYGSLKIGIHKEMSYDAFVADTVAGNSFAGDMFVLDPGSIKQVFAPGFKPSLRTDIHPDTYHGEMHEFYTKMSLKMEFEECHSWWRDVRSIA